MMFAAVITAAAMMCSALQSSEALQRGPACWDGWLSGTEGNGSCTASQPFLMFCHGKSIHRIGLDGRNQKRLVSPVGSSVLLDFHFKGESVYWADRRTGVIYTASVRAARRQKLYSFDKHISGLAVDWIGNFVYWTSEEKGEVRRMDTNGKNERTLLRNLTKPSSISVDPTFRFLFWLSFGMVSSVQRSDEGGRIIMTLLTSAEQLKALTIDHQHRRLFWAQFGLQGESAIASCDYSGKVLHIMDLPLQSPSFAMSLFLEHLYYTDARSHVVKRLNKYTGGKPLDVNIKPMTKAPVALKVVHPLNQPTSLSSGCDERSGVCVNVCSSPGEPGVCQCSEGFTLSKQGTHCEDVNECAHWNHGCSLGCENIPGSYFCTCPEGYGLLPDRKTCKEIIPCGGKVTNCGRGCLPTEAGLVCVCPRGSALLDDGQTCSGPPPSLLVANLVDVRVISADGSEDQTLVRDPRGAILAVDYDPIQNQVYFASISQKTIERIHLKGGSRDLLVSDDLLSPEGLAVDWVHRRMYWTDSSKSTIDGSTLAGHNRKTVVREKLERPKGIAVHPLKKKLIWTDVGRRPVVEASSLEGGDRAVIASSGLVAPTGLTIDFTEDRLFWCDQKRGVIESAGLDGSDRRVVSENQVELESPSSWMTTTSPVEDRTQHHNRSSAQRCPSSHEAYCLYQGVCFYYPEMEAYACNCVSGYMGERCQFSDLEWLELRRAEKEKRKKVTIAACIVVLLSLLSLIACVTYCFRTRRLLYKGPSVDDVREISVAEESVSQSTTASLPQFCPAAERRVVGGALPTDSPKTARSSSSTTETDTGSLSKHIWYQSPAAAAVVMETTQPDTKPTSLSQSGSCHGSSSSFQDPF
ncbi:pro-epidermal growth factor isoform X3 [Oryzias latipes]